AFVYGGRVYAPLRALAEKMGASVKWEAETQSATVKYGQRATVLRIGEPTVEVDGEAITLDAAPMRLQGVVYIPLRAAVEAFGATVEWDALRRAAGIKYEDKRAAASVTVAMLRADASKYELRPVVLSGEYRGWMPDAFSPETRHGPPESRRDFVLRDDTGDIYCASVEGVESEVSLLPLSGVGRRIRVEGVGAIARRGFAYVRARKVTLVTGPEGLVRTLWVGKQLYREGEAVRMRLTLRNPFEAAVEIPASRGAEGERRQVEFMVTDAGGAVVWRSSADEGKQALWAEARLGPGAEAVYEAAWRQTPNVAGAVVRIPGNYRVTARIGGLTTCPTSVRIVRGAS
ncbi:MAG: stalk domain-containing protein, partial [Armatimonadota bacterium]